MVVLRFVLSLILALSFVLGGRAFAQQDPDTTGSEVEALPPATDSVLAAPPVAAPEISAAETEAVPEQEAPAAPLPPVQPETTVRPDATTQPDTTASPETGLLSDSLAAELATLRAAVLGLAVQNDSLSRALSNRPARVDTIVVRDTTARRGAQQTIDEVTGQATEALQNFVPKLLVSILLVVLALYVVRGFVWLLEALAARGAERRLFYKKLIPIVRLLVWAFTLYLVISAVFRIPANSLLAAAAAVGVAVGFAAQEVLKNIFGGIVIILDQPFQVGDKIAVGGTYGEVVSIGLRSTRIVTPDDNLVSVPNSQVVADQVANANAGELNLQVVTDLYLPGWVDAARAKRIAYAAAANSKYVYLDKPITVLVKDEFKETFLLHLKVKAYVLDTRYEFLLMSDVTEAAKAEFIRHGLLTPMPLGVDVDVDVDFDREDDAPRADGHSNGANADDADQLSISTSRSDPTPPAEDA